MKSILNKKWYGVPVLIFALVAVLGVGAIVYAAQIMTMQGTVTVVQTGGGGTVNPSYTFSIFDAATGVNQINNGDTVFFNLGSVNVSSWVEKTIYVEKTGNASVTVTPVASGLTVGTMTFTPTSVTVSDATRQPIVARFTAGATPATANAFDITFTGSP